MKISANVLEAVGNTPLVRLNHITAGISATVCAKLEASNPGRSVKDRIALAVVEDAEKKGLLKPGGTIIEPTSGNMGVALAIVAAVKGYKCIFTIPDKMSIEKIRRLRAFGAEVVVTQIGAPSARFHVEQTLGAGDRSIAENYSGDRAFETLVDAVAWSIVHAVTPFEKRRAIFEIGKRERIREAINMLEQCGELSYAEAIKYGMLGKMYASNEVSAEYRRVKRFFGARPPRCY